MNRNRWIEAVENRKTRTRQTRNHWNSVSQLELKAVQRCQSLWNRKQLGQEEQQIDRNPLDRNWTTRKHWEPEEAVRIRFGQNQVDFLVVVVVAVVVVGLLAGRMNRTWRNQMV